MMGLSDLCLLFHIIKVDQRDGVKVDKFEPSIREVEVEQISMTSRGDWSAQNISGNAELHSETVSKQTSISYPNTTNFLHTIIQLLKHRFTHLKIFKLYYM